MLKRLSEYGGYVMVLSSQLVLADLDPSQHRHGCLESLVSGTLVVGGKMRE